MYMHPEHPDKDSKMLALLADRSAVVDSQKDCQINAFINKDDGVAWSN